MMTAQQKQFLVALVLAFLAMASFLGAISHAILQEWTRALVGVVASGTLAGCSWFLFSVAKIR